MINQSKEIQFNIVGLGSNKSYIYEIMSAGGNWPAKVSPVSGIIIGNPQGMANLLKATVTFCATTGNCTAGGDSTIGLLDYTVSQCEIDTQKIYSRVKLSLTDESTDQNILGDAIEVLCENCFPLITIGQLKRASDGSVLHDRSLNQASKNSVDFFIPVSGLQKLETYSYEFGSLSMNNWPVIITPISGSITPSADSATIRGNITFCYPTGECVGNSALLDYTLDNLVRLDSLKNIFNITITPDLCDRSPVTSVPMSVYCNDCIPKIAANISTDNPMVSPFMHHNFETTISNLRSGQEYLYSINGLGGNWPVKMIRQTGVFTPTSNNYLLNSKYSFCLSSGACPSEDPGVLAYELDVNCSRSSENLYNSVSVTITAQDVPEDTVTTELCSLFCLDCLPKMAFATEPSDSPSLIIERFEPNNVDIVSIVRGLDPSLEYTYSINSVEGNWPVFISPVSGNIRNVSEITIKSTATFCLSSGHCPLGTHGVMDYEIPIDECLISDAKYSTLNLSINGIDCNTPSLTSRDFTIICNDCIKNIDAIIPQVLPLVGRANNKGNIAIGVGNLQKNEEYNYEIKSISSNWPVVFSSLSGTVNDFSLPDNNGTRNGAIALDYIFCPSTGDCPNGAVNVLDYDLGIGSSCVYSNDEKLFAHFTVEITPLSCPGDVFESKMISLSCENCLPSILAVMPEKIVLLESFSDPSNIYNLSVDVLGLKNKQEYSYSFIGSDANWPIIISPKSGIIEGNNNDQKTISTNIVFAPTTGSVSQQDPNLIAYTLDTSSAEVYSKLSTILKGKIKLEIDPISCSFEEKITTANTEIVCNNCLPKIIFQGPFDYVLDKDSLGSVVIDMPTLGLSTGETYKYEVIEEKSTWPTYISPMTGLILPIASKASSIVLDLRFCANTGLCPSGAIGILDYSAGLINSFNHGTLIPRDIAKKSSFKLKITSQSYVGATSLSDSINISCDDCLPTESILILDKTKGILSIDGGGSTTLLAGNNTYLLEADINGLVVGKEYSYLLRSTAANWPVIATPASGSFIAKHSSKPMKFDLTFCHTTGSCPSHIGNVLSYAATSSCSYGQYSENDLFATLILEVTPPGSSGRDTFVSEDFTLICDKCLNPTIAIPSILPLSLTAGNIGSFPVSIAGLNPLETYSYSFSGIDSNWPTVISPASGSFKANKIGVAPSTIVSSYYFCSPTGLCTNGTVGLMDYHIDNYLNQKIKNNLLSTKVKMIINDSSCDNLQTVSEEITLSCNNCLPKSSYATIFFAGGNEIMLPTGCCSGVKTLNITVNNAIPGEKYSYAFSASDLTAFYPASGDIYFNTGGSGTINTVGAINILPTGQSMIQCSLTHSSTNISAIDFMALACGSGIKVDLCN